MSTISLSMSHARAKGAVLHGPAVAPCGPDCGLVAVSVDLVLWPAAPIRPRTVQCSVAARISTLKSTRGRCSMGPSDEAVTVSMSALTGEQSALTSPSPSRSWPDAGSGVRRQRIYGVCRTNYSHETTCAMSMSTVTAVTSQRMMSSYIFVASPARSSSFDPMRVDGWG